MTFKHSGDLGDIIYALPVIKALGGGTLLITSGGGTREIMSRERMGEIRPLLLAQPYIDRVEWWSGETVDYDFTGFRKNYNPLSTLTENQRKEVTHQPVDTDRAWLTIPEPYFHNRPVFARSLRYHNPHWRSVIWIEARLRYPDAIFVGLPSEHAEFERCFGRIEYRPCSSLLELADVIAGSSIFIGNQSCPYAIAEGLKVNSILEVSRFYPDCIFQRDNAKHIWNHRDWHVLHSKAKLMLALQFYPGDQQESVELLRLIVENEPVFRTDAEFALVARFDVDGHTIQRMTEIASQRFVTHVIRSVPGYRATGWPRGCNHLWQSLMLQLGGIKGNPVSTDCHAVLTFESDCTPMRTDWIDQLRSEWDIVNAMGRRCFGTLHNSWGLTGWHLNGNAVFSISFAHDCPEIQGESSGSWDGDFAPYILPIACDSPTIIQRYADKNSVSFEELADIRKHGVVPCILHGLKTDCGRKYFKHLIDRKPLVN